jgi:hypothetical protein
MGCRCVAMGGGRLESADVVVRWPSRSSAGAAWLFDSSINITFSAVVISANVVGSHGLGESPVASAACVLCAAHFPEGYPILLSQHISPSKNLSCGAAYFMSCYTPQAILNKLTLVLDRASCSPGQRCRIQPKLSNAPPRVVLRVTSRLRNPVMPSPSSLLYDFTDLLHAYVPVQFLSAG